MVGSGICHYTLVQLPLDMQASWGREDGVFWYGACRHFLVSLTQTVPRMPEFALANGLWGGPQPGVIADLTFAETMVVQRARLYISCRRVGASTATPGAPHNARPRTVTKNVIAYPQRPEHLLLQAGLLPADLHDILVVQFVGCDRRLVSDDAALRISVARLRAAFDWLTKHCWEWVGLRSTSSVCSSTAR